MIRALLNLFRGRGTQVGGPKFRLTGRDSFEFNDGDQRTTIFVEREGSRGIAILRESLRTWDSPTKGEPISDEDKSRIADLLQQHLRESGIKSYID